MGLDPVGADEASRRWEWAIALAACVVVLSLRLSWPGDTQWINDEPLLLSKAAAMNATGQLAGAGLRGTVGLTYGPVAVWIYAGLLRLTGNNLLELVGLRAALFSLVVAVALLWLASLSRRLRPIWVPLLVLSPYSWLYARHLWDNTWLIPLGALALASYASFNQRPSSARLWLAVLGLAAAALIHPMVAPLAIAITAHALRFHRSWLRSHAGTLAAQAVVALLLATPWILALAGQEFSHGPAAPPPPPPLLWPPAEPSSPFYAPLLFPLLGGRLLSAAGLDYFLEAGWLDGSAWGPPLAAFTAVAYPLVWLGIGLALYRVRRTSSPAVAPVAPEVTGRRSDLDFHLAWLCLAALAVQWTMQAVLGRHTHPHYYNGTWVCYALFLWTALSTPLSSTWLSRGRAVLGTGLAAALAVLTAQMVLQIHHDGGNRGIHFGATLQSQLDVARSLGGLHPDSPLRIEVPNFLMFPHALPLLRELTGTTGDPAGPKRASRVGFRDADPRSGWITVAPDHD